MRAITCENLKAGDVTHIHRFELAGLGKAPFQFVGMSEKTFQACPGAPIRPGSCCDYCFTGIQYEFWCRSADGKEFKVGCDCIKKVDDAGLIAQISKAERQLRDKKTAAARERKAAKLAERIEAAKTLLQTVRGTLSEQAHPSPYYASEGRTMLDYVLWCLENRAGEKACFHIEQAAGLHANKRLA